ncbi:hypothetical protein ACOME3_003821 [Neoechinorhynchus agilis]
MQTFIKLLIPFFIVTCAICASQIEQQSFRRRLNAIARDSKRDVNQEVQSLWEHYKEAFGKIGYTAQEEGQRFGLFFKNVVKAVDQRRRQLKIKSGIARTLGLDRMAEWTEERARKFKEAVVE